MTISGIFGTVSEHCHSRTGICRWQKISGEKKEVDGLDTLLITGTCSPLLLFHTSPTQPYILKLLCHLSQLTTTRLYQFRSLNEGSSTEEE